MKVVRVSIIVENNSRLRVKWTYKESDLGYYLIDHDKVNRKAKNIREKLYHFVKEAKEAKEAKDNDIDSIGYSLKNLAEAGSELYKVLFKSEDDKCNVTERIKKYLRDITKPFRIHFTVDSRVHIPWGLIYDGEIDQIPKNVNSDKYQDFWCLKYSVAIVYCGILPPVSEEIQVDSFKIIHLFHKDVYDNVIPKLDSSETKSMQHLLQTFSNSNSPLFTSEKFFSYWQKVKDCNMLVYICCHADETNLALSINDSIEIDDFDNLEIDEQIGSNYIRFIFLNGCSTAVGHKEGGFLEATGKEGFYGFIGTECKIPDIFAIRFALDFILTFIYTGKPIFEIMTELRNKHWPLSLIYSLSCDPYLKVSSLPKDINPHQFTEENLSYDGRLGSSSNDDAWL